MEKGNPWALLPFIVFLVLFIGSGSLLNDFYAFPVIVAITIASAVALLMNRKESFFKKVEIYKIKKTKFGYIFSPLAMIGIFLIADIPIFSRSSLLPITLIVLVFTFSIYYTFKYSIFERFRKLFLEISEIEQLEKE